MISLAPQTVQNRFTEQLRTVANEDRLASVRRYYELLHQQGKKTNEIFTYQNIDARVQGNYFFYFPTEAAVKDMNCFERASSLYFAFSELYPQSQPALVYLDQPNIGIHAIVLFTHDNELYAACPTYGFFDKVRLEKDAVVLPPENGKDRRIKFSEITQLDDRVLAATAQKLRTRPGIVDFVYESGQRAGAVLEPFIEHDLFMYVRPDLQIAAELRMIQPGCPKSDACVKLAYNPFDQRMNFSFSTFARALWHTLEGEVEEQISRSPFTPGTIEKKDHNFLTQMKDVAVFLNEGYHVMGLEQSAQFVNHPVVVSRFGDVIAHTVERLGLETLPVFLSYLRHRFGSPEQIAPYKDDVFTLMDKDGKPISFSLPNFDEGWEKIELRYAAYLLKMALDAKRYAAEVSRQIVINHS